MNKKNTWYHYSDFMIKKSGQKWFNQATRYFLKNKYFWKFQKSLMENLTFSSTQETFIQWKKADYFHFILLSAVEKLYYSGRQLRIIKPILCSKLSLLKTSWQMLRVLLQLSPLGSCLSYLTAPYWGTVWPCS